MDTDQLIEEAAGMPIKELVALEGWETFREKEKEAIASLREDEYLCCCHRRRRNIVRANRDLLKNMGILIYLKTPLPDIIERLKRDARDEQIRPQFTSG